jgi:hypothetical protein
MSGRGAKVTLGSGLGNIFGWVNESLTGQPRIPDESVTGSNDPNLLYIFAVH